jgi:hypothetical protein
MPDERAKVDIGFTGGQVLALRFAKGEFDNLRQAIEGETRFYDVDAGDSTVTLDLSQVVYLRVETEDHRVGF